MLLVSGGTSDHASGGAMSAPSAVYFCGSGPPSMNAGLVTLSIWIGFTGHLPFLSDRALCEAGAKQSAEAHAQREGVLWQSGTVRQKRTEKRPGHSRRAPSKDVVRFLLRDPLGRAGIYIRLCSTQPKCRPQNRIHNAKKAEAVR